MKKTATAMRYCPVKHKGGYSNSLVTFNACVNCEHAIISEEIVKASGYSEAYIECGKEGLFRKKYIISIEQGEKKRK